MFQRRLNVFSENAFYLAKAYYVNYFLSKSLFVCDMPNLLNEKLVKI